RLQHGPQRVGEADAEAAHHALGVALGDHHRPEPQTLAQHGFRVAARHALAWRLVHSFSAELVLPHDDQAVCERAALDAAGCFALRSFAAGRHRLRVRAPGGAFGDLEITRDLDLDAGENRATVGLRLTAWRGEIPAAFRDGRHELLHDRDGWQVRTHLHAGDDG